jgi:hypothetical protein
MDNLHTSTAYEVGDDYLRLTFNEGETLEVWGVRGLRKEGKGMAIQSANRVRWEWNYYGRPKLPENRYFVEHVVVDGKINATSSALWYKQESKASLLEPAVTIL